ADPDRPHRSRLEGAQGSQEPPPGAEQLPAPLHLRHHLAFETDPGVRDLAGRRRPGDGGQRLLLRHGLSAPGRDRRGAAPLARRAQDEPGRPRGEDSQDLGRSAFARGACQGGHERACLSCEPTSFIDEEDAMPSRKLNRDDLRKAAEKYKNWGKWGPDDEIGTLNYTQPEDIVAAARLVKKGKVISLALNFDQHGPQGAKSKYPAMGHINPLHLMLRTGTDAYSGVLDQRGIRAADDVVVMPLQCGTQWDGLGHVFYESSMWNGYDCREVTTAGAQKCGIEKTKQRMV